LALAEIKQSPLPEPQRRLRQTRTIPDNRTSKLLNA